MDAIREAKFFGDQNVDYYIAWSWKIEATKVRNHIMISQDHEHLSGCEWCTAPVRSAPDLEVLLEA